jgi:tRNA-splicing ligase RtcB
MNQLITLADSGIAEHHISVMPDVHIGKGATVGTVFASTNYVSPNAVGVDIGCGMCAVPVDGLNATKGKKVLNQDQKEQIFSMIKQDIPTGFNYYESPLKQTGSKIEAITENSRPSPWLI